MSAIYDILHNIHYKILEILIENEDIAKKRLIFSRIYCILNV